MKTTLYITRGLPGSGVLEEAVKMTKKDKDLIVISDYYLRAALGTNVDEDFLYQLKVIILTFCGTAKKNILISGYNIDWKEKVEPWKKMAKQLDYNFHEIDFTPVSLKYCIQKDQQSDNPFGKIEIIKLHNQFIKNDTERNI